MPILKIGIKKYPCSEHIPTLESEMFWTASLRRGQRMHLRQLLKCELSGGGRVGRPRWPKNCRRRPRWKSRKVEKSVKQRCRCLPATHTHDARSVQVYFKGSIDRLPTFFNNDQSGNGYLVGRSRRWQKEVTYNICHLRLFQIDFDTRSFSNMVTIPLIRKWKVKL